MRCKRMYVNVRLPLAGGLIKQTTAAADWSVRLQRICRSIRQSVSICQLALSLLIEGGVRGLGDQPAGLEILPLRVRGGRPRGAGGHGARPRPGLGLEAVCSVAWSETRGDEL